MSAIKSNLLNNSNRSSLLESLSESERQNSLSCLWIGLCSYSLLLSEPRGVHAAVSVSSCGIAR